MLYILLQLICMPHSCEYCCETEDCVENPHHCGHLVALREKLLILSSLVYVGKVEVINCHKHVPEVSMVAIPKLLVPPSDALDRLDRYYHLRLVGATGQVVMADVLAPLANSPFSTLHSTAFPFLG